MAGIETEAISLGILLWRSAGLHQPGDLQRGRIHLFPILMKKLFYNLSLIVAPLGLLVLGVNYFIDPANIFSGKAYVAGISDVLVKGHNVDNVSNYDERALQEQMVRKLPYRPDVVVLGSSRV